MTATPHPVTCHETVWIPMPDGARLACRLWLPDDATARPVPAILEYIPYRRRDRTRMRDDSMHPRFAAAGYAVARVDMRGSGDRDGVMHDEYLPQELQDGAEVIAWLAAQPWCTGSVGMMGKSWGAYNSLQVAALRPPALKAILPVMGTDDRWAECIHYSGGTLRTDEFWWGSIMQLYNALPPDRATRGQDWRELWLQRLNAMGFWPAQWMAHQTRDDFFRHGSVCQDYADIQVPVFFMGGWEDLYRDTPFRLAQHLRVPYKLLMGPWAHLYPHEGVPGPAIDFVAEALRWWDHWLKGLDTGVMDEPPIRLFLKDSMAPAATVQQRQGDWIEEPSWPSPQVQETALWLNRDGLDAQPRPGGPVLSVCTPLSYGQAGGDLCSFGIPGDLPGDGRLEGAGALGFTGPVLQAPLAIAGEPRLHLSVSADQPVAQVIAVLYDQRPDGALTLISRGMLNLCHRHGPEQVAPVVPGEEMTVTVALHGIAYRVPAGHRLVVHVASSYWPMIWPSPTPVTLSLAPGRSRLVLPERTAPIASTAPRPLPPPPAVRRRARGLRPGALERSVALDLVTGRLTQRTVIDGGVFGPAGTVLLEETGTQLGDLSERIYSIRPDDPLSARAEMTQTSTLVIDGITLRIETRSEMTVTASQFHLVASVVCRQDGQPVHHVNWSHSLPRHGL